MEVTGPLTVKLWASSNAPDTDFTAKLIDVYPPSKDFPAGVELNVQDGIIRARYRESLEHAALMKPGDIYPFAIEMYPTSVVFQKGHRIRVDISSSNFPRFDVNSNTGEPLNGVDISSSNFPRFDVNSNTGEPLNDNRHWAIATNTIYHDAQRPSQILLRIIPK